MKKTNSQFFVNRISRAQAQPFIEAHHYTRSIGKVSAAYGLFNKEELFGIGGFKLLGVITFGQVSARDLPKSISEELSQENCFEFLRMAVLDSVNCERTWFISRAIKLLKLDFPQIVCLVSFADQTEGHFGYVYQAANWGYYGVTGKKYHYLASGKRVNKRVAFDNAKKIGLSEREYVNKNGWVKIEELPKFRYVYPLKCLSIKLERLPYPKENK